MCGEVCGGGLVSCYHLCYYESLQDGIIKLGCTSMQKTVLMQTAHHGWERARQTHRRPCTAPEPDGLAEFARTHRLPSCPRNPTACRNRPAPFGRTSTSSAVPWMIDQLRALHLKQWAPLN